MARYLIGVDLGGTHIRIGAMPVPEKAEGGTAAAPDDVELVRFRRVRTREVLVPVLERAVQKSEKEGLDASAARELRAEAAAAALADFIRNYTEEVLKEKIGPGEQAIAAVAVGFPAAVSKDRQTVLQTPNIAHFPDNFEAVERLEGRLGCSVLIDKDTNFLLLADLNHYGFTPSPYEMQAGIYYGTGIGGALACGGRIMTGADGIAGEIGHLPVYGRTETCGCGNPGCLECFAGGEKLAAIAEKLGSNTGDVFIEQINAPQIRAFLDAMAVAAASVENLLNPEVLLIGGGIPAMDGFPRETFAEMVKEHARKPYPAENLHLLWSEAKQENGVAGAILYAKQIIN